jgi:hypothetical protein
VPPRSPVRRLCLARIGAAVTACLGASVQPARAAPELERPRGKVILTISGKIGAAARNDGDGASFDEALFEQLPQTSFKTRTPWYPEPRKFTGVLVADLLKAVDGSNAAVVKAVALNDYRVEIPVDDLTRHGAMVASRLDDQPIAVRDKGPLLIIYPFDTRPDVRSALHYSRAIWQLRSLELR